MEIHNGYAILDNLSEVTYVYEKLLHRGEAPQSLSDLDFTYYKGVYVLGEEGYKEHEVLPYGRKYYL